MAAATREGNSPEEKRKRKNTMMQSGPLPRRNKNRLYYIQLSCFVPL